MPLVRLQKVLAQAGYGSRRTCEKIIVEGRVIVNGEFAKLGQKVDPNKDKIYIDGQFLKAKEDLVYIALYKTRGVLSITSPDKERRTLIDIVDVPERVYPVGRLDIDSEGLILLTNDGELANLLSHPRYGHEKEYKVLVARHPDEKQLQAWRRGIVLEDGYKTAPAVVKVIGNHGKGTWLRVIMKEGKKRQIRQIGKLLGLPVVKIIRIRIGSLKLGKLKPGEWRYLKSYEVEELKSL